jgi:hypothetical protein
VTLLPGTRGYTKAIVAAQMLAQIGAFALPALLPDYIARWNLTKTEAGWLVGLFFAAYVVMVPVLVAFTDRVPVRRVYMLGTSLTALSHFGFALFADGFWSALLLRLLAGIGWAGTYMPGLKAIADPLCRDGHRRRPVAADGMERNRAGYCRGGAGRAVEYGDLFRQLGLDRRHRAGRRQVVARRHDGLAQHVAIACNPTDRRRPPIDSPDCGITHRLTITVDVSKRVRRPFGVPTR